MRFLFSQVFYRAKIKYGGKNILYLIAIMLFFWSIFAGIFSYLTPILITEAGYSSFELGLICSTASIAGAISDFFISKFFAKSHYTRLYLYMFLLSFGGFVVLYYSSTLALFILAMILWGIFYDLMSIASFDFVGNDTKKDENAYSFGIIELAGDLGGLTAPIIAGYIIVSTVNNKVFLAGTLFLLLSFLFFLFLKLNDGVKKDIKKEYVSHRKTNVIAELHTWTKLGRIIFPVLVVTAFLNFIDAFFWTLGPLYSLQFPQHAEFGGIFLTAYMLPSILADFVVGKTTERFGKKKTAFLSVLAGSVVLIPLLLFNPPVVIIVITFISSMLNSVAWPAVKSIYADYIEETKTLDREIEGLADFFNNIGNIIGPILAGICASLFGLSPAFGILGILGVLLTLILIKVTPKHIRVPK